MIHLNIEGKRYDVDLFEISLHQDIDESGFPTSPVKGGIITLGIPFDWRNHDRHPNSFFFSWMITKGDRKDGIIEFYDAEDATYSVSQIKFVDAFCVNYKKAVDYSEGSRSFPFINKELISISARIIEMDGVKFDKTNFWPD